MIGDRRSSVATPAVWVLVPFERRRRKGCGSRPHDLHLTPAQEAWTSGGGMATGRALLDRLRPIGAPGAAAQRGVPAGRLTEFCAELDPLFALLAEVDAEAEQIRRPAEHEARPRGRRRHRAGRDPWSRMGPCVPGPSASTSPRGVEPKRRPRSRSATHADPAGAGCANAPERGQFGEVPSTRRKRGAHARLRARASPATRRRPNAGQPVQASVIGVACSAAPAWGSPYMSSTVRRTEKWSMRSS